METKTVVTVSKRNEFNYAEDEMHLMDSQSENVNNTNVWDMEMTGVRQNVYRMVYPRRAAVPTKLAELDNKHPRMTSKWPDSYLE